MKTERDDQISSTVSPSWSTVDSRTFEIPAGESQLVVVDFSAETGCFGTSGNCSARILVGRTMAAATELEPAIGIDFFFDSLGDDFEGHSMSRALCVRNATASSENVTVWFQATRTSANITQYSLDNWTFKIARNAPCSPAVNI